MIKRKATPKGNSSKPTRSTSTTSAPRTNATRTRSQSVASRRPTPVSNHEGSKTSKSKADDDPENLYRVRSFTTKTGVVVNRGDSFKRRSPKPDLRHNDVDSFPGPQTGKIHSPPPSTNLIQKQTDVESIPPGTGRVVHHFSSDCNDSFVSALEPSPHLGRVTVSEGVWRKTRYPVDGAKEESSIAPPVYKVQVLGSPGVGKTTLTKQLLSSEYYSSDCNNAGEEKDEETVTVQLDDEESVVQFIDSSAFEMGKTTATGTAENRFDVRQGSRDLGKISCFGDGFLVVYSVTDRASFRFAQQCLQELRPSKRHNAVILVANKHDLVRKRLVPEIEGMKLATKRHCKFIEVSALLDHRMDELLVGIVRQIRLRQTLSSSSRPDAMMPTEGKGPTSRLTDTIGTFFQRIFKKDRTVGGKCDDLMTP